MCLANGSIVQTISNDSLFDKESFNKKTINSKEDSGLYNISSCSKQSQSKEVDSNPGKTISTQNFNSNKRDQSLKRSGSRNYVKFPRLVSVKSLCGKAFNNVGLQQGAENDDKIDFKTFCINLEKKLKFKA